MHIYRNILRDNLEQMLAECEDHGREAIQPMLTPDEAKIIIYALERIEPCNKEVNAHDSIFKETVDGMLSADYTKRFKAEYQQTKIRYEKLHKMLIKADAGTLEFTPTCPIGLLREQKAAMGKYLYCLEVRAEMEKIDLKSI